LWNNSHVSPRKRVTVGVGDGQDVPVDELLEFRAGENLIDDPEADGGSNPFTRVQSAIDPDGFFASAGGDLEDFQVATFGGGGELDQGDESGVGVGVLVEQGVDLVEFHVAIVDGLARLTASLLLDDLVLGALPQDGAK
jgi:hypothetical protein